MNCNEFEYSAEYGLGHDIDENVALRDHAQNCAACQTELNSTREIRKRVNSAVLDSSKFQIDPMFNNGLDRLLKAEFLGNQQKQRQSRSWMIAFVPALAALIFAVGLGVFILNKTNTGEVANNYLSKSLAEIGSIVAGNHVYCTLEKLGMWQTLSHTDYPDKAKYTETVLAALKANYSGSVELVSVHDCAFEGKDFRHVILRNGPEIVSVFLDQNDIASPTKENLASPIVSGIENGGFQVASFESNARLVFVVSKLSETDNLTIARTLSYTLGRI